MIKPNLAQNVNTFFRTKHTLFPYFLILLLNCNFQNLELKIYNLNIFGMEHDKWF